MAAAAKKAGLLQPTADAGWEEDEPQDESFSLMVPLNRRLRNITTLANPELTLAHEQSIKRMEGLTPQDKNYIRYQSYRDSIERLLDARKPETEPVQQRVPPPAVIQPDEELPWERERTSTSRNASGLNFAGSPNDTPGSD